MAVERNEDGSVTIKTDFGTTSIGNIMICRCQKREEEFQGFVEEYAKLVNECEHTLAETEQYFLEICESVPISQNDRRMKTFMHSLVINFCQDKLKNKPSVFSHEMTDDEIENWDINEKNIRSEIRNSSAEDFGLIIRGYCLPRTERNKEYYDRAYTLVKKDCEKFNLDFQKVEIQDICCFFEETMGYFQVTGVDNLHNKLLIYKGITKEDIDKRSYSFLAYIGALRDVKNEVI